MTEGLSTAQHVCVYKCINVCICVYVHTCVYLYIHVCIYVCNYICIIHKLLQLCLILCDPLDCRWPVSSIHGILQAKLLDCCHFLPQGIFLTWGSKMLLTSPALAGESFTVVTPGKLCFDAVKFKITTGLDTEIELISISICYL